MTPAGYMAKRVMKRPESLNAHDADDIFSVSHCMSEDFADYINFWKHNGYWLFDAPQIIRQIADENSIDLKGTTLFYYEVYELQFEEDNGWKSFAPEPSIPTAVIEPAATHLEGFDVVTFSSQTSPECSPLSCNHLAGEVNTNSHCLLFSLEDAIQQLEQGKFRNSEPGPYRIFAVYTLP